MSTPEHIIEQHNINQHNIFSAIQRPCVLWFTGLSGSGKSTLAVSIQQELQRLGKASFILDGDNIRKGLNADLAFSKEDRKENIRRVAEVAKLFTDAGLIVLSSFISPFELDRQKAKSLISPNVFVEIYLDCSLDTCEKRDPKGLYKKARQKLIPDFTGISSPYETPKHPDITLNTDKDSVKHCVDTVIKYLKKHKLILD